MKDRISKLLTIKSIVTVALTVVFCYLAIVGVIDSEQFMLVFTTIIAFYFGTQKEKKDQAEVSSVAEASVMNCPFEKEAIVDGSEVL